jgi:hypothetical protein
MKNIRLLSIGFLFLLFCSSLTWGQTADFTWNFGTTVGDSSLTSGTLPNLTVSPVSVGNIFGGTLAYGSMLDSGVPSTGYTGASGQYKAVQAATIGSLVTTPGGSAYFEIILTPAAGYAVTVNSIAWGNRSTATGPEAFNVKTDKDQYASNIALGTLLYVSGWEYVAPACTPVTGVAGVPLHVRIYGSAGSGSAQPSSLNWNIDDLDLNVTIGSASATPYLSVDPWTLTGFSYLYSGGGPSTTQTYTLTGVGLSGAAVTVTPPNGYQVSTDGGSTWTTYPSAVTLTYTAPNLSQVLTVRLKAGLAQGIYSGNVVNAGGGASNKNCIVSGNVRVPLLTWASYTFVNTSYILGQGPSGIMTYTITGQDLAGASISVTAPSNFELSVDSISWGSSKTIAISGGVIAAAKVYVRLVTGLAIGSYSGNLAASGGGATTVNQALTGAVTAGGLLFSDDFSYSTGNLATQSNGSGLGAWVAASSGGTNPPQVVATSLTYTNLKGTGVGGAVQLRNVSGEDDNHQFTNITSGTVYASAMVNVTTAGTAGDYILDLNDAGTYNYYSRVFVIANGSGYSFGISKYNGTRMYSSNVYTFTSGTHLLVFKYTFVNSNQKDSSDYVNLFIDPTPGSAEPAPDLTSGGTGWTTGGTQWQGPDAANISGIFVRQGSAGPDPTAVVDGIKVGQTWAQVTPVDSRTLTLTAFLQGYTNTGGTAMNFAPSAVTVELHNATTPWALVESQTSSLSTAGVGTFNFTTAVNGTPYFIVVKTWNTIQTWSATAQSFTAGALSYDFTTAATQAYASNMVQKGTKWCIFSGDVNQDGYINLSDYVQVNYDSYHLVTGVVVTDLTGDQYTNLNDYVIVNLNSYNLVVAHTPLLNPAAGMVKPPIMVNIPK